MVFSTFDPSASLFLEPARITEPLGWVGHIPFAFWITEAVKPAVFVELGTHTGNSYFSFCQSVAANRLPTSCYAVDTWEGDHHAGFYGNDVFVDVDSYNSKHYDGFSHLLRMTFNQALERFSDGSIDLLHIDGLHTYEAVRHDFENWHPKMSSRGIVLFHDINVCERDFGVWKFWEEVSARYPHIAFDHSHGLGVLLVGHEQNLIITAFVHEFQNKSSQDIIKSLFARTGRLAELEYRTGNLSRDVADRDLQINAHSLALAGRDEQINALSLTVGERDEQINALSLAVAEHDAQINSLTNTLEGRDVEIKKMITSNSWRITKPVRKIHNSLRKRLKLIHYFFYPIKRINKSKKIVFSDSDWYLKQYKNISTDISPSCFYINYGIANYQNKKNTITSGSTPTVSIIIPVYGKLSYTLKCIDSLLTLPDSTTFEIIIVDDCSPVNTHNYLFSHKKIKLIKNDINLGFIKSCNYGAENASGKYIIFLNNDTEVQPGWLDCLIAPFIIHDNIGLVGSQLIYPNGQLQEAGGIIWSDGSGLNYGRMDDPQKPEYNYLRDVDYCSGCSIAIKKALFDTIGGFDTRFVPAYYEDTDLAFTVCEMGYRVVYQPASKLIHHEGITSGTDINSGIKAYQEINKINFVNKWSRQLSLHRKPGDTPDLAKERIVIGSILFIDAVTPTPDMDSGSVDAFFYLYILSKLNYKITFIPDNIQFNQGYTQALQQIGIECIYKPYIKHIEEYISAHSNKFDYIFISRVNIAIKYIDFIKVYCPQAKIIFNTVDIHYIRQARQAWISKSLNLLHIAKKTKKAELKLLRESDISIVISSSEINHLKKIDPELNLFHIPLMLDMHQSKTGFANRKDIIFLGGFEHEPNVDAVIYFVQDIWPIVKEKLPDINFIIIGSKMPKKIQQLHNINGIIITGYVKILSTYFDSCKISIAPLRYGAGQKGKLARSGSYGVPAVVTPLAAEGMNLEHNKHVLIAKSPESFAENIIKLYLDKTLWEKLSINIYEYTKKQFSLEMGKNRLINLTALLQDDTSYQKNTSDP